MNFLPPDDGRAAPSPFAAAAAALSRHGCHLLPPTENPPDGLFAVLAEGLRQSSFPATGPLDHRCLAIALRDREGLVLGGLWGSTLLGWLNIEMLYIPDSLRRGGLGTTIVLQAETEARRRGCAAALVDTFDPAAARFYERAGFTRFAELDGFPPGHRRLWYRKSLSGRQAG